MTGDQLANKVSPRSCQGRDGRKMMVMVMMMMNMMMVIMMVIMMMKMMLAIMTKSSYQYPCSIMPNHFGHNDTMNKLTVRFFQRSLSSSQLSLISSLAKCPTTQTKIQLETISDAMARDSILRHQCGH